MFPMTFPAYQFEKPEEGEDEMYQRHTIKKVAHGDKWELTAAIGQGGQLIKRWVQEPYCVECFTRNPTGPCPGLPEGFGPSLTAFS